MVKMTQEEEHKSVVLSTKITPSLKERFDKFCKAENLKQSDAVSRILEDKLKGKDFVSASDLAGELKKVKETVEKMRRGTMHLSINSKVEDTKTTIMTINLYELFSAMALKFDEIFAQYKEGYLSNRDELKERWEQYRDQKARLEKELAQLEMLQDLCRQGKFDLVFQYFKKGKE